MMRTAALAITVLLWSPGHAVAGQAPDEEYEACLIGNSVIGVQRMELSPADAYERAYGMCSDVAETVPDTFCSEESAACGPVAVSEYVIHYFENVIAPKLTGYTLNGELGAEH